MMGKRDASPIIPFAQRLTRIRQLHCAARRHSNFRDTRLGLEKNDVADKLVDSSCNNSGRINRIMHC